MIYVLPKHYCICYSNSCLGCVVDEAGDLFVVERDGHRVRKIDMNTGLVSTVAGTGEPGFAGDGGPATAAQLKQPHSIQVGLLQQCVAVWSLMRSC